MKVKCLIVSFVLSLLSFCPMALSETVPYSTDFSTDPCWVTDQPSNYYWDASKGTYFVHNTNTYPGYYPNRYAGKTMAQPVDSFELRWDVDVKRCDWSSGLYFGVWDSSLKQWDQGGEYIRAVIGSADNGRLINFDVGANGIGVEDSNYPGWSLNNWYTFKISYDSDTKIAALEVFDTITAQTIWSSSLAIPGGGFTRDLQFLGSNLGMVGQYGYSGIDQFAVLEANIDNVQLTPEPATILLLTIGGLILRRKKL